MLLAVDRHVVEMISNLYNVDNVEWFRPGRIYKSDGASFSTKMRQGCREMGLLRVMGGEVGAKGEGACHVLCIKGVHRGSKSLARVQRANIEDAKPRAGGLEF